MNTLISSHKEKIFKACKMFKVKKMYVFGSALTSQFKTDSDIDFLISFQDVISVEEYTNNYFLLKEYLQEIFNKPVDLTTEKTLSNPYFIENINKTKQLIYGD